MGQFEVNPYYGGARFDFVSSGPGVVYFAYSTDNATLQRTNLSIIKALTIDAGIGPYQQSTIIIDNDPTFTVYAYMTLFASNQT